MIDQYNLSELEEMILLGFREQAIHPQGLNSSHTHGTLYPVGDPRNDKNCSQNNQHLPQTNLYTDANSRQH